MSKNIVQSIRFANGTNPRGVYLGETVKTRYLCEFEYDSDNNRIMKKISSGLCDIAESFVITGTTQRCEGHYTPTYYGRSFQFADDGDEPATFKVTKRIRLYLARKTLKSNEVLIHPDDIQMIYE